MHLKYRSEALRRLRDEQVRSAARPIKLEQLRRIESLIGELEPRRWYSYDELCYRITGNRAEAERAEAIAGRSVQHDLACLLEDLSDSADISVEELPEPVYTVDELSRRFQVSTKTISRWRNQGLASLRLLFGKRKRVGFRHSTVERFVARNRMRVERGARFSQLTDQERGEIFQLARRLARAGGSPSEVIRRVAQQVERSVETIRYTLKQFDQRHPNLAVFPHKGGPLDEETKRRMYEQFASGSGVEELARRFCRTRSSVYRIINEMRAVQIMELPLDYVYHESFTGKHAADQILAPMPDSPSARRQRPPSGLPPYLASLYEVPLLTREQEAHLFRKYNYLKYRAAMLRERLDVSKANSSRLEEIENLYQQAIAVKNQIVKANLRLVVSIAKRHVSASEEFFGLVSDGNMSLIRAIEKFDFSRGNKFSTYASWAIMKNFARTIPDEFKHRDRYRTSQEEMFVVAEDTRSDQYEQESAQSVRESQIDRILSHLDEREQQIIVSRFGLDHSQEPLTLKEVGARLGVTKERIRQIEARALSKLRAAAAVERIELPD